MSDIVSLTAELPRLAALIQGLVDQEFERWEGRSIEGTALDQAGLRDGRAIALDYLKHGEHGLARDHLVYMVQELEIALDEADRRLLGL